jgi:hypothetical protein
VKRKLTADECFARAEAYEECADHLALEWTADPVEKQAGEKVESALRIKVKKWRALGQQRTRPNVKVRGTCAASCASSPVP